MLSLIIKELEANEISTLKSLWCILNCINKTYFEVHHFDHKYKSFIKDPGQRNLIMITQ